MSYMATTTHTMVVKLAHEVVAKQRPLFLSSLSLLHVIKKILRDIAWNDLCDR
jgi:hypothetical protein